MFDQDGGCFCDFTLVPWRTSVTPSKLWKNHQKFSLVGHWVTSSRPWLKASLKVKLWRLAGRITCSKLLLNRSPKVRLWRLLGRVIPSRLWLKQNPNVRLWRPSGKVAWNRLSSKPKPKVKCWRFIGHATPSKLWTQIKLWRPAGKVRSSRRSNWLSGRLTFAMFWLKLAPNFNDWRFGIFTPSKVWLKRWPKVKSCKLAGKSTCFRLWLNRPPKVKDCRDWSHVILSMFWSKCWPNLKHWRLLGQFTLSKLWLFRTRPMSDSQTLKITWSASARLWLNPEPNVKLPRLSGQITCSRLWLNLVGPTNFEDWACSACSPHPSGQIDTQCGQDGHCPAERPHCLTLLAPSGTQLRICDFLVDSLAIFEVPSINFHSLVLFLCHIMLFWLQFPYSNKLPSLLVVKWS